MFLPSDRNIRLAILPKSRTQSGTWPTGSLRAILTLARLDSIMMPDTEHDTIPVTLRLDPEVYEFFSKKARKAGVGLETYLNSTLSIVLGCKAFEKMPVCSPQKNSKTCCE